MSDRDVRSEARTFWIMPLAAQPLKGSCEGCSKVYGKVHIV